MINDVMLLIGYAAVGWLIGAAIGKLIVFYWWK